MDKAKDPSPKLPLSRRQMIKLAGGAAGSNNGSAGITIWKPFCACGGSGGGASNSGVGGAGAAAGVGSGGGGGGGGTTGGAGGRGGDGLVVIVAI